MAIGINSDWNEWESDYHDVLARLHTGGISEVVVVPRSDLEAAITVLTTCGKHGASHVFVVDQSRADLIRGFVHIGVSRHGADCLRENL